MPAIMMESTSPGDMVASPFPSLRSIRSVIFHLAILSLAIAHGPVLTSDAMTRSDMPFATRYMDTNAWSHPISHTLPPGFTMSATVFIRSDNSISFIIIILAPSMPDRAVLSASYTGNP